MTSLIDMDFVYLYCSGRIGKVHRLLDQTASSRCLLRSDTASTLLGPAQVVVVSSSASSSSVGGDTAGSAPAPTFVGADGYSSPFFDAIDGYYSLAFVGNMDSSKNKTEGLVRVVSHMTYRCLSLLNAPVCCLSESASILNPTSSDITQHTYYIHYVSAIHSGRRLSWASSWIVCPSHRSPARQDSVQRRAARSHPVQGQRRPNHQFSKHRSHRQHKKYY